MRVPPSDDGHHGGVPAARAVGNGTGPPRGLRRAGLVGGPHAQRVQAGGGVPVPAPLAPGVEPAGAASVAWGQGPLSVLTSTAAMPLRGAQATPATVTGPALTWASGLGTSIRDSVLTGAWA